MKTKKNLLVLLLVTFSLFASCSSNSISYLFSAPRDHDPYYSVEFDSDGGTYVEPQKVEYGKNAFKPEDPSKEQGYFKYQFGGWYENGATRPFDFDNTPIEKTTYLKAKWTGTPPEDSYHFKFTGTNCLVNNLSVFEMDIPAYAPAQFMITTTDSDYALPSAITIEGAGKEKATYTPETGIISISQMVGDITITASADSIVYQFSFTGTDCKIGDSNPYQVKIKKGEQSQFTIKPDPLYDVPQEIEIVEGENVSYENGVITISEVTGNVTIKATSHYALYNSISFNGVHCKADIDETGINADYNLMFKKYSDQDSLTLYLFPDEGYQLPIPETVRVSFIKPEGSYSNEEDYVYDKTNQTLTINKDEYDAVVSLAATPVGENQHMVTIDANGGVFFDGISNFEIQVNDGDNLSNLLRTICAPTLDGCLFGYYTIIGGPKITYDFTVSEDLNLIANYFQTSTPYSDLNNVTWDQIKQVAATNSDPYVCFNIGATKAVTINNKSHTVRIIGTNHDTITNTTRKAVFTFEFANVISQSSGTSYTCQWDKRQGSDTKNYDFIGSTLNTFITDTILPLVRGSSVGQYMELVNKASGRTPTIYSTYLFPLAYDEMMNHIDDVPSAEGEKYEYYAIHTGMSSRIKRNVKNEAKDYWLRSPDTKYSYNAWSVLDNGEDYNGLVYSDNNDFGIAPAFCV